MCYKCEQRIEPQIQAQWFVKMKPLTEKSIRSCKKTGEVKYLPSSMKNIQSLAQQYTRLEYFKTNSLE